MMKIFHISKDGGPESNVTGYWLIECKAAFSIVLLRVEKGSREAYHTHAFNAISWIIKGKILEECLSPVLETVMLVPSFKPVVTLRNRLHKVKGVTNVSWVLSFRGPWTVRWNEYFSATNTCTTLTSGRVIIAKERITQ